MKLIPFIYCFIFIVLNSVQAENRNDDSLFKLDNSKQHIELITHKINAGGLSRIEQFESYFLLSEIKRYENKYKEALLFNLRAKPFILTETERIQWLNQRGSIYFEWSNLNETIKDSSLFHFNETFNTCLKKNNLDLVLQQLNSISHLINGRKNKAKEALVILEKSLELAQDYSLDDYIIKFSLKISQAYLELKDYEKAKDYLVSVQPLVERSDNTENKLILNKKLSKVYNYLQHYEQELSALKKVISYTYLKQPNNQQTATNVSLDKYETERRIRIKNKIFTPLKNRPTIFYIFVSLIFLSLVFLWSFKRMNKKLTLLNQDLIKSVHLNKKILSILSHDLKQPIISLEAMFFLLDHDQLSEDEKNKSRDLIKNHLKTTNLFIDDIMTWAKLEIAKTNQFKELIKPQEIVDSIYALYQKEIEEKSLIINTQFPKNFEISGLRILNYIILKNLINNAIKFGFTHSTITISHQIVNQQHQFSVSNEGPPIPQELQEKLFDENKKLQYLIRNDSKLGFGLGLSIISGLIKDNNGRIWLSQDTERSTVKINFYIC